MAKQGMCKICGKFGPLSFEHVPPRAAFNDRRVIVLNFEEAISLGPYNEVKRGTIQQRILARHGGCEAATSWQDSKSRRIFHH